MTIMDGENVRMLQQQEQGKAKVMEKYTDANLYAKDAQFVDAHDMYDTIG